MSNKRLIFIIIICLVIMSVFAFSYISAYNLKISGILTDEEQSVAVEKIDVIDDGTKIVMEIYDIYSGEIYETDFDKEVNLMGKNRSQLNEYIIELNNEINEADVNNGLLSYQLIYFSGEHVTIRKNYDTSVNVTKYVLKEENGYIVVYEYPQEELYHNTGIMTISLDEETRNKLLDGIHVKDDKELFDYLESFSS